MSSLKAVPRNKLESELADLRGTCASLEATIEAIRTETAERLREPLAALSDAKERLSVISVELTERQRRDALVPTISDHALLRYIERVHGIDIEQIRAALLTPAIVTAIKNGAAAVRNDEFSLVIRDMTVVTVNVPDRKEKTKKMSRARLAEQEEDFSTSMAEAV